MAARDAYQRINDVLNDELFDGREAGRSLYLIFDSEARARVAGRLGIGEAHLEVAICACVGATLEKKGDPYSRALVELRMWRNGGMSTPPPFTAILFALSHAAAIMDGDEYTGKNNYYSRLAQLTRLERGTLSLHGKSTEPLWIGLNDWLLQHNYELGRPTARALNSWIYVGYALSQAIVRVSDRVIFHDLFDRYGFSGSETITPRDMEHYLSNWMNSAGPSQRLKRFWRDQDLHERVAEAAIAELRNWGSRDGKMAGTSASKPMRLGLLANLVAGFPRPSLELHLARVGDLSQQGPFILRGAASSFYLSNDVIGGVSTISPSPFGEDFTRLSNAIHLDGPPGTNLPSLEWEPRLIMPFAINATANTWFEVPRVSFATPHLLLVRNANNLPASVERYFALACTTPPGRASDELEGLPPGWVLYQNVQVRQLVEPAKRELECLVPFDDDGVLALDGGLQLLSSFYHSSMLPRATFVAGKGPTNIEARAVGEIDTLLASAASEEVECTLLLQDLAGVQGARVRGWGASNIAVEKELFFRDSGNPHPLHRDGRGQLAYTSVLSASQLLPDAPALVQGLATAGEPATIEEVILSGGAVPEGEPEELQEATLSVPLVAQAAQQTCVERGYHVTRYPMIPEKTPAGKEIEGVCSDCKRREFTIYRGGKDAPANRAARIELPALKFKEHALASKAIDTDILLDALCFLGHGSWPKLQALASAWGEGAKNPRQIAHELCLLGFLDLELKPGSNAIKSWCVPSPSLAFTTTGQAFLAGFRSPRLVEEVRRAVDGGGGSLALVKRNGLPTRYVAKGLTPSDAERALQHVRDQHGRPVSVLQDAAARIAGILLTLEGIDSFIQSISIGRVRNLQRFDLADVKWKDVPAVLGSGAYRWNDGLQVYAYVDPKMRAHAAPYQVVKLLAARGEGMQLHRYNANEGIFLSTLGCEPPGLLERALVACSGELPSLGRGTSVYKDVTPAIASTLLSILYQAGEEHEERKSHQRH